MSQSTKTKPQAKQSQRGAILSNIGTVTSAIMASACCWLPMLLLVFGVSGAGIASTLEVWRPLFIVVTFAFLAAAFYFTYRTSSHNQSINECGTSEAADCCKPSGRKYGWQFMNKLMLWAVAVFAVIFLFFPGYVAAVFNTKTGSVTADMNQSVFEISGMTCEGCATTVAQTIKQVPGVDAVDVNYEKRTATVGVQSYEMTPTESIKEALQTAGLQCKKRRY